MVLCLNPPTVGALAVAAIIGILGLGALGATAGILISKGLSDAANTLSGWIKSIIEWIWNTVKDIIGWIIKSAPGPIRIMFFVMLFWLFGGFLYSSTFGITKICHPTEGVYVTDSIFSGMIYKMKSLVPDSFEDDIFASSSKKSTTLASCDLETYGPIMPSEGLCFVIAEEGDTILSRVGQNPLAPKGKTDVAVAGMKYYVGDPMCTSCEIGYLSFGIWNRTSVCVPWANDGIVKRLMSEDDKKECDYRLGGGSGIFTSYFDVGCQPPAHFAFDFEAQGYIPLDEIARKVLNEQRDDLISSDIKSIERRFTKYSAPEKSIMTYECIKENGAAYYTGSPIVKIGGINIFDFKILGVICLIIALIWVLAFLKIIRA